MPTVRPTSTLTLGSFDRAVEPQGDHIDFTDLTFIDVYGLVGTAVVLASVLDDGPAVTPPERPQVAEHLSYMGLATALDQLGDAHQLPPRDPADREDVVVPLALVRDVSSVEALSHLLFAQLQRAVDPQVLNAVTEALWELAANALEHSGASAFIAGQVYKSGEPPDHDDKVLIVIGDAGRGIRASFLDSGTHLPRSDAEAIDLAVQYLVSSVQDPGRGQGLYSTISEVTGLQGTVVARSGHDRYVASGASRTHIDVPALAGTIVAVSLPLRPGLG